MDESLTELYLLHCRDGLPGDDARWGRVQAIINASVEVAVEIHVRNLFGTPLLLLTENVQEAMLTKFLRRRLPFDGESIEGVFRSACRNEVITALRRQRSVTGMCFDGAEQTWEGSTHESRTADIFDSVRLRLHPFRFPEHQYVREALLVGILSSRRYPDPDSLGAFGVPKKYRKHVHNAAVFDINRALYSHLNAH